MLTDDEVKFVQYWEANRLRRKKVFRQLAIGLPFSVVLVSAILVNFLSGWYKKADMELRTQSQSSQTSLVLVVIIAALVIVVFIVIFSVHHKWDMYEQHYRELLAKKDKP